MKNLFYILICIGIPLCYVGQSNIIPEPVYYQSDSGSYKIDSIMGFDIRTDDRQVIEYSRQFMEYIESGGIETYTADKMMKTANSLIIELITSPTKELGDEGYMLTINNNNIILQANHAPGIFNGIQTLRQLLPADLKSHRLNRNQVINIDACSIVDYPRFKWRGLMLDVSRHFFTVDEVKAFIDKMSMYKFNVFHWHLTDDNGWRIEIKSLPKLTEIGAWRVERHGRFGEHRSEPEEGEGTTYGGYYTHEQIKDVVQYAAARNISIVPEIDVPGHSMALLSAYPELSTGKTPKYVSPGNKFAEWYGDGSFEMLIENMLNPTDEKVYDFLDKIFTEVAQLFPGEYIHMGGDECYHGFWEKDHNVKEFMTKNNISDGEELQSYFVKRVEKIISNKGKKMIGWDEILLGGLADNAAVMSWRGVKGGIEAAKMGHDVVMSPTTHAYLDYTQGDYSVENKIYADLSLEKVYTFEPVPEGVDSKYILGGQGNLWTEAIPNLQYAYYMTYPRAFALSETLWSPKESKEWNSFISKVQIHFQRFDDMSTNICKAVNDPIISVYRDKDKLMCALSNSVVGTDIFYTIDNTYPVKYGIKYTAPFEIPMGDLSLRTRTYSGDVAIGRPLLIHRDDLVKRIK